MINPFKLLARYRALYKENIVLQDDRMAYVNRHLRQQELISFMQARIDEEQRENAELKKQIEKKQEEHDLTFHQLHMMRASIDAHIARAKAQEGLIYDLKQHVEFLRTK